MSKRKPDGITLQCVACNNAEFLIMLETWQAAVQFSAIDERPGEAVEIARLLGWVDIHADGYDRLNHTARACVACKKRVTLTFNECRALQSTPMCDRCHMPMVTVEATVTTR